MVTGDYLVQESRKNKVVIAAIIGVFFRNREKWNAGKGVHLILQPRSLGWFWCFVETPIQNRFPAEAAGSGCARLTKATWKLQSGEFRAMAMFSLEVGADTAIASKSCGLIQKPWQGEREMNRREFGKAALGVATAVLIAPMARAVEPSAIIDCIVIDYEKDKHRLVHLKEPDFEGRNFVYEDSGEQVGYRHFEFLRSDGLVMGQSSEMQWWTQCYDSLEDEFMHATFPAGGKRFSRDEFRSYVEGVRDYFNGRIVPVDELAAA